MNIMQSLKNIFGTTPTKSTKYTINPYLKEFDKSNPTIKRLEELKHQCQTISNSEQTEELNSIEKKIDKQLHIEHIGKIGEEKTFYQLRTFDNDKFILYDIYFHDSINNVNAQIDFIFITNKYIYLIEVKHLNAWKNYDICFELKNNTLIPHAEQDWKKIVPWDTKDPIEQSNRHKRILSNIIKNSPSLNKYTSRLYDIVVLSSNSKSRLYSKKEIIEQIVLVDKLAENIKAKDKNSNFKSLSLPEMYKIGTELLRLSSHNPKTYTEDIEKKLNNLLVKPLNDDELRKALIEYRDFQRKNKKIPAYCIYKDSAINNIIKIRPKTTSELREIDGFGDNNTSEYGNDILDIVKKYTEL